MNPTNKAGDSFNARLQRIKTVSRVVRRVILGLFVFTVGYFLFHQFVMSSPQYWVAQHWLDKPGQFLTMILLEGVLCFWYWKLAQLFQFYERGLIFATETIRCIKTLGLLCVVNWVFASAGLALRHFSPPTPVPAIPPDVIRRVVPTMVPSSFSMGFFSFSIGVINVGLLLAGIIIVIIAWIMDEGRKMREEQELTV